MTWVRVAAAARMVSRTLLHVTACASLPEAAVVTTAWRANNAAPTKSSPDGVRPLPTPSKRKAAVVKASASSSAQACASATAASRRWLSGNGSACAASKWPKPAGFSDCTKRRMARVKDCRASLDENPCPPTVSEGCTRAFSISRQAVPHSNNPPSASATRGCIAASTPTQTISFPARRNGVASKPGTGRVTPPQAISARWAIAPQRRTAIGAVAAAARCGRASAGAAISLNPAPHAYLRRTRAHQTHALMR